MCYVYFRYINRLDIMIHFNIYIKFAFSEIGINNILIYLCSHARFFVPLDFILVLEYLKCLG